MKQVKFSDYIQNLPSNIIIEYLCFENSPRIFTKSVYENITAKFYEKNHIAEILANITNELKNEIFQIYLCGNLGKKIPSKKLKSELLETFLVFEGVGINSDILFGFPDLEQNIARNFAENLPIQNQKQNIRMFFGTFLNDCAIILNMFENSECKIRNDGKYSQRWTDLLKERCGIGKLMTNYDDLVKILDFIISFMKGCGARISSDSGKITLLSNSDKLLEKILEKSADLPKVINDFSKNINLSLIKMLVDTETNRDNWVKIGKSAENIYPEIDFSLKFFHWCGLIMLSDENCFKIKDESDRHFQNGHILPDFSIYIPTETNPMHLKKLLYSIKITSVDVIYHGKIDKKQVEESLANGIAEKEIMEILLTWNAPLSLLNNISEWIQSFQRVFEDLPYIAFRNDIAKNISEYADLKDKLIPMENYTFFRVKSGEEQQVSDNLKKFGFDLRRTSDKITLPLDEEQTTNENLTEFNKNPNLPSNFDDYIFERRAY